MATDAADSTSEGRGILATGGFTGDGTVTTVNLGFVPKRVELINVTDRISQLWVKGMAATTTLNTDAAGARTANTSSLIVERSPANGDSYRGFSIAAAAAISAKVYVWSAWA